MALARAAGDEAETMEPLAEETQTPVPEGELSWHNTFILVDTGISAGRPLRPSVTSASNPIQHH